MDNQEKEQLQKELDLINKLEKLKPGGLVLYKLINFPDKDPNLFYTSRTDCPGLTEEEMNEEKQYYARCITIQQTLVTRENAHLYKK